MSFRLLECLLVDNNCYKKYHTDHITPTGIIVHSTDKADGDLKRYVQPASNQSIGLMDNGEPVTAEEMIAILGKNIYNNSWNRPAAQGAVHGAIGRLANGSYAVVKTLDYTQPCWGAYKGPSGSYDGRLWTDSGQIAGGTLYVQFEIVEDGDAPSKEHCTITYELAVKFSAYLCRIFPTIKIENIISHKEANKRGRASAHGDPEAYWKRVGVDYTMDGFRAAVKAALEKDLPAPEYGFLGFPDVSEDDWYAGALEWAVEHKIVLASGKPFNPEMALTKASAIVLLRRMWNAVMAEKGGA